MPRTASRPIVYDNDYSDYYHGLTKDEYESLRKNGRVFISLNS